MPRYVAFLRAVNVGGQSAIKMDVLRRIFEELGFSNVQSFIASGNIIFETPSRSATTLETLIEAALIERLGFEMTPFIRSGPQLARIVAYHAFPNSVLATGDQLAVLFLSTPPGAKAEAAFKAFHSTADEFELHGSEIYWLRHTNVEGAAYTTVPLDKALDQPFTIRSMSTLKKLVEKYAHDVGSKGAS